MLKLIRTTEFDESTFGVLCLDHRPMWVTLEDAWKNNEQGISCIPKGPYVVRAHNSPHFGRCFKVLDVPNRSDILFHAGNTRNDTKGCILLGLMFGTLGTQAAILSSRSAMAAFLTALKDVKETTLEIV